MQQTDVKVYKVAKIQHIFDVPDRKSRIQSLRKFTKYALGNMYTINALIFILTIYLLTDSMIDSFFKYL